MTRSQEICSVYKKLPRQQHLTAILVTMLGSLLQETESCSIQMRRTFTRKNCKKPSTSDMCTCIARITTELMIASTAWARRRARNNTSRQLRDDVRQTDKPAWWSRAALKSVEWRCRCRRVSAEQCLALCTGRPSPANCSTSSSAAATECICRT